MSPASSPPRAADAAVPGLEELLSGRAAFRLPLSFDPAPLAREVARLPESLWDPKGLGRRGAYYAHDGRWRTLTLRGRRGAPGDGPYDVGTRGPFPDAAALRRSPRLKAALDALPVAMTAAQLFRLEPGGAVMRHVDPLRRYRGRALVPAHLVLTTNPSVRFFVNGRPLAMKAGEVWALNATLPHEVYNGGTRARVHLIAHLLYDEVLAGLLRRARALPAGPADFSAARAHARRYLERARFAAAAPSEDAAARRRRAALVAQLLRMRAA
ncbi:MAG: aspartyl/asparaginyl beta-hydroxylase domain-containing protein [Elusimicrobiota bacterium]|nr:aspartyl/asparaginyl beta-hydroxylase domain-containing protein [Elusimicrobiota bacterium]